MADQQITGDPIVDALIASRQNEPQPLVEAKPYDLSTQINSGFDAAKDLVDRYTQNLTEANRSAADLQRLAIENMRSGSPGRMLLGAGQNVLAPIAGVMSPLTGGIETARQGIEYRMGAPFGNAFEVAANIAQGPEDIVNAARLAARSAPTVAHAAARDIARRMDQPAQNIENDIRGLNKFLSGMDLEANSPDFHTGFNRPQVGGAGMPPKADISNFINKNIKIDNPATSRGATDWLQNKIEDAEISMKRNDSRTASGKGLVGATTARANIDIPISMLQNVSGAYNEKRMPGVPGFDDLLKTVKKEGWNPDPISLAINHKGEPYIYEGNTRVAVAKALGIPSIPTTIHWMNGAENASGNWHIENFAKNMLSNPDIKKAYGGRTMGNNAIGNALRMARDHFGFGGADRDAAEGSTYSGNVSHDTVSPSSSSPNDNTGGGSRSDSGIGGGGNDRSSPTSDPVREAIEKELPNKMTGVEGATPIGMPTSMKELMNASGAAKAAQEQQQQQQDQDLSKALGLAKSSFFSPDGNMMGFNVNPSGPSMANINSVVGVTDPTKFSGKEDIGLVGGENADPMRSYQTAEQALQRAAMTSPKTSDIFSQAESDRLMSGFPSTNVAQATTPSANQPTVDRAMVFDPVAQGFVPVGSASPQATALARRENVFPSSSTTTVASVQPPVVSPSPTDASIAAFNNVKTVPTSGYNPASSAYNPSALTAFNSVKTVPTSGYDPVTGSIVQASNVPMPLPRPSDIDKAVAVAKSGSTIDPDLLGGVDLPASTVKTATALTSGVPMPTPRPEELKSEPNFMKQVIDSIKSDFALKEGERINALEAAGKTATFPGYSSESDPLAAQREYVRAIGLNPDNPEDMAKVQARIIQQDGQDRVDYYTKTLGEALFGPFADMFGKKTGAPSEVMPSSGGGGGGGGGGDTGGSSVKAGPGRKILYPYQTELGESAGIPSLDGMSAEQWAAANAGGDLSRVHGSLDWSTGAPRVVYHL
jgi:hypothetical protein